MVDQSQPEAYTGPVTGYPPHSHSPALAQPEFYGSNSNMAPPQTSPSPPSQAFTPGPGQDGQQYSGYAPSMSGAPSQYGPPSAYGGPGYGGYGAPQPPPNSYPGYGAPPTQSMYGAPPGGLSAPQAMAAPPTVAPVPTKPTKPKICGLPRAIFWIILVSAVILILGAIGAGLGVGLSNLNNNNGLDNFSDSDDSPSRTRNLNPTFTTDRDDDPTSTPTRTRGDTEATTTRTRTSANLSPTGTATSNNIQCPRDDRTSFLTDSGSQFNILCNTYVPGTFSESTTQSNMGDCIQACHSDSVCTGVLYWFSNSITLNCDMYYSLEVSEAESSTTDYAFGGYDWALDAKRRRSLENDTTEDLKRYHIPMAHGPQLWS